MGAVEASGISYTHLAEETMKTLDHKQVESCMNVWHLVTSHQSCSQPYKAPFVLSLMINR